LYIADEVMCGMGRTGTLHAFEQDGVVPDIVTIAKGLGGGYQPIGAVLVSEKIVAALQAGSGMFQHGHTYICHPTAAAAALAVQQVIERDHLLERCSSRARICSRRCMMCWASYRMSVIPRSRLVRRGGTGTR
jgi:adenosylmethionine-8-amino-7-oxononanoate aminotransferase